MTSRERLLTVLRGEMPDCVPVAPDFSNMIPARQTGKPFWDHYLYNDPPMPLWEKFIVLRNSDRIVVQESYQKNGKRIWKETVDVYYVADPPTEGIKPESVGLRAIPEKFVPVEGGRFILSTGDQCGRDTPDENLMAMVETARTYGRY